ncbi:hypothetical protein EVAR_53152_1 [Eumeta japonica]|uniref:Uncharacterized protein n=1 Tax=Eumeta variegata TaxID=151549 RepID=A0A4C1YFY0_EUMVA|nr:hypothetical protein EVAR_53152_1 [Eumeta japonica]
MHRHLGVAGATSAAGHAASTHQIRMSVSARRPDHHPDVEKASPAKRYGKLIRKEETKHQKHKLVSDECRRKFNFIAFVDKDDNYFKSLQYDEHRSWPAVASARASAPDTLLSVRCSADNSYKGPPPVIIRKWCSVTPCTIFMAIGLEIPASETGVAFTHNSKED